MMSIDEKLAAKAAAKMEAETSMTKQEIRLYYDVTKTTLRTWLRPIKEELPIFFSGQRFVPPIEVKKIKAHLG